MAGPDTAAAVDMAAADLDIAVVEPVVVADLDYTEVLAAFVDNPT